jgi:hypothetical protein
MTAPLDPWNGFGDPPLLEQPINEAHAALVVVLLHGALAHITS